MSAIETARFTQSNLLIEAQRPAIAIDFAPPVTDTPDARQERVGAVLATVAFAIDAGLRTQDPANHNTSRFNKLMANLRADQGDTDFVDWRIWRIGHYERENPDGLRQLGSDVGRVLMSAPDTPLRHGHALKAGKNIFGNSVAFVGYSNSGPQDTKFDNQWRGRHFGVAEIAENTLALGLYSANKQYIEPEMLARELAHPDLSEAMGQDITELGIRLSADQPVRIDSLLYEADSGEDRSISVPNVINLQGVTDYLNAQKTSNLLFGPHRLGEPFSHAAHSWTYLGHEDDSGLAIRFEIEAFSADRRPIQFIYGDSPGELVAVDKDKKRIKTPATLSGLYMRTYAVSPLVKQGHLLGRVTPTEDILFSPELREAAEELNTALHGIRESLIER